MDITQVRLELLKLAVGNASLPIEAEAVIKTAQLLEKFVDGSAIRSGREDGDSEQR